MKQLDVAKDHVSEADHEVKLVMSEILKYHRTDIKNITILRDAHRMLEEVYRMLDKVQHDYHGTSSDTDIEGR